MADDPAALIVAHAETAGHLTELLSLAGFKVEAVSDALAPATLYPSRHDLVITTEREAVQILQRLHQVGVQVPVIVLSPHTDWFPGATICLHNPSDLEILQAARKVFQRQLPPPPVLVGLTVREREVLQELFNGRSNKEAAIVLGISPRTVEVHRASIMEKLGARNAVDLIHAAMRAGWHVEAGK